MVKEDAELTESGEENQDGDAEIRKIKKTGAQSTAGLPVLQVTVSHFGDLHVTSENDTYEYQFKSVSGLLSPLVFDEEPDMIEVTDGDSTIKLKRSMVNEYRRQAKYYGALKVFREHTKVLRDGREELVVRTSLVQVKVTAKGKDGKELSDEELRPAVARTPGIIPPCDPEELDTEPIVTTIPISFGDHVINVNKNAIDKFKKMANINCPLKAQMSKLYKCRGGVDVPITVVKLFAATERDPNEAGGSGQWKGVEKPMKVVKWPPEPIVKRVYRKKNKSLSTPECSTDSDCADIRYQLSTKNTEIKCELSILGKTWSRGRPKFIPNENSNIGVEYQPADMNAMIPSEDLWAYLINYVKDIENLIDFEYEINDDRWLELKRASNTFHINGEMWPDLVLKVVYKTMNEEIEIHYFIRVLGRLIKSGVLLRGCDVQNLISCMTADHKICVGVVCTPYFQNLEKNEEMKKYLQAEAMLVLHPFDSLYSVKCKGIVRDVSQTHSNLFKRNNVLIEGEQVVCPPCLTLCAKLNQLFATSENSADSRNEMSSRYMGNISASMKGSRVMQVFTEDLNTVLSTGTTKRDLLQENSKLNTQATKKEFSEFELQDNRPDIGVSEEQFMDMVKILRPEAEGTKKALYKSCYVCKYSTKTLLDLFAHMKCHLGQMTITCDFCNAKFADKASLDEHTELRHGESIPACQFCAAKFNHKEQLYDHMNRHRNHLPFLCSFCQAEFSSMDTFKKHLKNVHHIQSVKDLQISCKVCNLHFYTVDHLLLHRVNMNHTDGNLFTCKVCGFDFDSATSFREHIMTHSEEEREVANIAVCPTCCKLFFSLFRLSFHIENTHIRPKRQTVADDGPPKKNKGPYIRYLKCSDMNTCPVCQRRFKTMETLENHIHFCHKDCDTLLVVGNQGDPSTSLMKSETQLATEFVEMQQGDVEGQNIVVDGNMLQVGNEVLEVSSQMDGSGNVVQVDQDMLQVANDLVQAGNSIVEFDSSVVQGNPKFMSMKAEYSCSICNRKFETNRLLSQHLKIHTGNKPVFQCEECGQIYSKKSQVLDHIRTDHVDQVQRHEASQGQQFTPEQETPVVHFVEQASEQQVEVATAEAWPTLKMEEQGEQQNQQEDVCAMIQLQEF